MAFEFGSSVKSMQVEYDPVTKNLSGITHVKNELTSDGQENAIFVLMGGIAVNQRIRGIKDPGCIPYNPGNGTGITSGTVDDSDLIEGLIPDMNDEEHAFHNARAVKTFRGAMSDVHHIMDNPSVEKGMQALADVLLAEKKLTGMQARKVYFDARGPIPPVSVSYLKKIRKRLRKSLPRIDFATLTAEIKAKGDNKPEGNGGGNN